MIQYDKFHLSLRRLVEQYENHKYPNYERSKLDREGIGESVIQRFETCYDCLWKVLKRYLIEVLGVADPPYSPKPILRLANENNLIASPLEQWLKYANARVRTSYDYDGKKAKACLVLIPEFIDDAIDLYETISKSTWEKNDQLM